MRLGEIVTKYATSGRTRIIPFDADVTDEDLIAEEDVVVTITRGGLRQAHPDDLYRAQRRAARGGAAPSCARRHRRPLLRDHDAPLDPVLTNRGGCTGQAYELPDTAGRPRQHVANLLAFQPTRGSPRSSRPGLLRCALPGHRHPFRLVKKSLLTDYDSTRSAASSRSTCVRMTSHRGQPGLSQDDLSAGQPEGASIRFTPPMRPCARWAGHLRRHRHAVHNGDELLDMHVSGRGRRAGGHRGGYAKRTPRISIPSRPRRPRRADARIVDSRGELVGALMVDPEDEVFAIHLLRRGHPTSAGEVKLSGRQQWACS